MQHLPQPPPICALCGEFHRNLASHLWRVHGKKIRSAQISPFRLNPANVPKVSVEKAFTIEKSKTKLSCDLNLSFLSDGKIALTRGYRRPLRDSDRFLNLKRSFPFRRELQFVWYDSSEYFSLFYKMSNLRYSYNKIEMQRCCTLIQSHDKRLEIFKRQMTSPLFDKVIFNPLMLEFGKSKSIINKRHKTYVPSALVVINQKYFFVHYEVTAIWAQLADHSELIAEARKCLYPYPLVCVNDIMIVNHGDVIGYKTLDDLPRALELVI